jgi:uncharacterized membrane protein YjfL (UPF0719 family)
METGILYLKALGWIVVAVIGFAISIAISLFIFSKMTPIDEWAEVGKGNMAVALIIITIIVMSGLLVFKVM